LASRQGRMIDRKVGVWREIWRHMTTASTAAQGMMGSKVMKIK